jgi:hypothetical protein
VRAQRGEGEGRGGSHLEISKFFVSALSKDNILSNIPLNFFNKKNLNNCHVSTNCSKQIVAKIYNKFNNFLLLS